MGTDSDTQLSGIQEEWSVTVDVRKGFGDPAEGTVEGVIRYLVKVGAAPEGSHSCLYRPEFCFPPGFSLCCPGSPEPLLPISQFMSLACL